MNQYLARLPHVLHNVDAMLRDRGFAGLRRAHADVMDLVTDAAASNQSLGALLSERVDGAGSSLYVAFLDPLFDVGKAREVMTSAYQLQGAATRGRDAGAESTLIISFPRLSPDATRSLADLGPRVQVLTFQQLAVCLREHALVPRHTALSAADAKAFEARHGIPRRNLPVLRASDPVAQWYNWPRGTVVRIERPTGPAWRTVA